MDALPPATALPRVTQAAFLADVDGCLDRAAGQPLAVVGEDGTEFVVIATASLDAALRGARGCRAP